MKTLKISIEIMVSIFVLSMLLTACGGGGGGGGAGKSQLDATVVGSVDLPGTSAWGVTALDNYVYVGLNTAGLQAVDVTNPSSPVLPVGGLIDTIFAGGIHFVQYASEFLLVPGGLEGVHVIDATVRAAPTASSTISISGNTASVVLPDALSDYLCAAQNDKMTLFNSSTAFSFPLSTTPSSVTGVAATASHCYFTTVSGIAGHTTGSLEVLQISGATSSIIASLPLPVVATGIVIQGNFAYLVADFGKLQAVDISTPDSPTIVGETTDIMPATGSVALDSMRSLLYVGTAPTIGFPNAGISVIDISNPIAPVVLGTINLPNWTKGVDVAGNYVYAVTDDVTGTGPSKLHVIDISRL